MFIRKISNIPENTSFAVVSESKEIFAKLGLSNEEFNYLNSKLDNEKQVVLINRFNYQIVLCYIQTDPNEYYSNNEKFRIAGSETRKIISAESISSFSIIDSLSDNSYLFSFMEGISLSEYKFVKYKNQTKKNETFLKDLFIVSSQIDDIDISRFKNLMDAVNKTKDLVNEPMSYLNTEQFAEEIKQIGKEGGFKTLVLNKKMIEKEGMNGILTVSKGAETDPTFTIMEYKPENSINQRPFVLIGKGVTFDSGGITLKPYEQMQYMKIDMAGGASVAGILYAAAKSKLPVKLIGLVPAVENMPGGGAAVPGDIIKMANGMTVEMKHPDAEGRLILADALIYAKRYSPQFILTLATLTGSAYKAFGSEAIPCMTNAHSSITTVLRKAGLQTYERLVMLPNFQEYDKMIDSSIADVKNVGGTTSGMMTAGKFLMRFTEFPLIHLDIAGTAFMEETKEYRDKGATGVGVRLIFEFLKRLAFDELV